MTNRKDNKDVGYIKFVIDPDVDEDLELSDNDTKAIDRVIESFDDVDEDYCVTIGVGNHGLYQ